MTIRQQTFPYNTNAVSKKQFEEHLKLYKGYVDKSNAIYDDLLAGPQLQKDANKTYSEYRGLKKGESYALDGVILHELYFQNMTQTSGAAGTGFRSLAERCFGGFDKWANDFTACAKAARGWCVAAFEQRTETLRNILLDAHDEGVVCAAYPLLVIDMYEHAYFMDYGTDAAGYIKKFMDSVCWKTVDERVGKVIC